MSFCHFCNWSAVRHNSRAQSGEACVVPVADVKNALVDEVRWNRGMLDWTKHPTSEPMYSSSVYLYSLEKHLFQCDNWICFFLLQLPYFYSAQFASLGTSRWCLLCHMGADACTTLRWRFCVFYFISAIKNKGFSVTNGTAVFNTHQYYFH